MFRILDEMSHVDQYGFHHQFDDDENLALHYLCQQLHQHYRARRADSQTNIGRWEHLLVSPGHLSITSNKVALRNRVTVDILTPTEKYPKHGDNFALFRVLPF